MLGFIITALIIVLISLVKDFTYAKDLIRNDNNNDILKELLQRMDKMQSHVDKMQGHMDKMQGHMYKMETNNNKRFDQLEKNNFIRFDQLDADNKNLTVVMQTIVEQQMVITAEIFTVSQTLPFCCCQYKNSTDAPGIETTTITAQPETTTSTIMTSLPANCADAMGESGPNGIYQINVTESNIGPFDVYCMRNIAKEGEKNLNGTWLTIQRKHYNNNDFHRDWKSYKLGFGDLEESFWIGLDKIYALTTSTNHELWVQLEDIDGSTAWATYSHFGILSEGTSYELLLGFYDGTAGDSLTQHQYQKWSTYDKDNDNWHGNCANVDKGAWWFDSCGYSNLNRGYAENIHGIYWDTFGSKNKGSLTYAHMAIRPQT